MRRVLSDGDAGTEFWQQLAGFRRTAWRLEQQPVYVVAAERANYDAFLAGRPQDPLRDPYLGPWMRQVAQQTRAGRSMARVRVQDRPPTDYQRWERWLDRWNTDAGERIAYISRADQQRLGAPPFGDTDWWLFDDQRVMIMYLDDRGVRIRTELAEQAEEVAAAIDYRRRLTELTRTLANETSLRV